MISAFIVCRDAAHLLPSLITNARRVCSEVLVAVDPQSSDDTLSVARTLADDAWLPERAEFMPDSARNEAAARCHGDWLLMLDDDELLPPALQIALLNLASERYAFQEYVFRRRHVSPDGQQWITSEPWWPDWQVRLRSRQAWQQWEWPVATHGTPPDGPHRGWFMASALWHLKFAVKSAAQRTDTMQRWGATMPYALSDHFRKFSLPESYHYEVAPFDEPAPQELAQMLEAGCCQR